MSSRVPDRVDAGGARNARRWVVYYDGECSLCETVRLWFSRLDVSRSVEWAAYQSLERPPSGLSWSDLESAVWLDSGNGRHVGGFHAFRMLALRLPPLMALAPALWLPGMGRLGELVYGWVARNRCRLSSCIVRKGGQHE